VRGKRIMDHGLYEIPARTDHNREIERGIKRDLLIVSKESSTRSLLAQSTLHSKRNSAVSQRECVFLLCRSLFVL